MGAGGLGGLSGALLGEAADRGQQPAGAEGLGQELYPEIAAERRRGYSSAGYADLTLDELGAFEIPPILPIRLKGYDHFVVFRGRYGDRVLLADPAFGNLTMTVSRFLELWKGGIGFVVTGVEREESEGPLDIAEIPFANPSVIHRLTGDRAFSGVRFR